MRLPVPAYLNGAGPGPTPSGRKTLPAYYAAVAI